MPAAVLFDLDETLLDRTTSLRAFLKDQFSTFAAELGAVRQDHWVARFLELDKRGSVHKSKVYPALLGAFGGNPKAADSLFVDYTMNCCKYAQAFAGMEEALATLRQAGKRLAIVTNGESAFQRRHVEALSLARLVDEVLVSEEENLRKPDAAFFRLAATRLGVEPVQCLFVGDNPAVDVIGAAQAGMQTLWFRCGQTWPDDLPANPGPTVEALADVLAFADVSPHPSWR
jgi:putative hydrolase of the HAD superfamily